MAPFHERLRGEVLTRDVADDVAVGENQADRRHDAGSDQRMLHLLAIRPARAASENRRMRMTRRRSSLRNAT